MALEWTTGKLRGKGRKKGCVTPILQPSPAPSRGLAELGGCEGNPPPHGTCVWPGYSVTASVMLQEKKNKDHLQL